MRASYRWLKELLPDLTASPDEVARRFGAAGLAVDGVRPFGFGLESILVVKVLAKEPHPKRAALNLVTIDRGGIEQRVVCGAGNVPPPGGLVVLAPLGTWLPHMDGPLTPKEIGGVLSEGMLCSETELGLAESAEGILVLPEGSAAPGARLIDAFPTEDTIYELDVTPNRSDALGHVGLARELAALLELRFTPPPAGTPPRTAHVQLSSLIGVENRDTERCPHYGAAVVLDVSVAASPLWLKWRLQSLGVRPISNVVDITNLLLLEFGQPLHAFDLDRVRGGRIIVRRAQASEPFSTLDGVARTLDPDDLVIADAEGPSALAGVMGGQDSEIRDDTRRVMLECAYFTPRGVRRTARRYGLHTEASHRFERGVDYAVTSHVLARAKTLLCELASGAAVPGSIEARGAEPVLPEITLRSGRLDALLGVHVPFGEARAIIERLGFPILDATGSGGDAALRVGAVSFRPDVTREVDLIEEVCRVRGLDAIPTRLPAVIPQSPRTTGKLERDVGAAAAALGLSEAVTYAFVSEADLTKVHAPKPWVRLDNPLSEERNVMRTSLLPGLLEALRRARRRGETRARLFTLGSCFGAPVSETRAGSRPRLAADIGMLPREELRFAAVLAGSRQEYLALKPEEVDVYDAKGLALALVERVTGQSAVVRLASGEARPAHLHPRGASQIVIGDSLLGHLGPLHPDVVEALDLGSNAQIVELDLEAMERLGRAVPQFRAIPRLPAATRDLSLVVGEAVAAGKVGEVLEEAGGALCESIELVALFRGGSLGAEQKSLTFRIICRDPKARSQSEDARTLTDKEVDEVQSRMVKAAESAFGATLRG